MSGMGVDEDRDPKQPGLLTSCLLTSRHRKQSKAELISIAQKSMPEKKVSGW